MISTSSLLFSSTYRFGMQILARSPKAPPSYYFQLRSLSVSQWLKNRKMFARVPRGSHLRQLIGLAYPVRWRLAGGICLLFISSAVTMSFPFFMGKIVDSIFHSNHPSPLRNMLPFFGPQQPSTIEPSTSHMQASSTPIIDHGEFIKQIKHFCFLLTGVFCIGAAANFGRIYLMQTSGQMIINRLRISLYHSLLKKDVKFFDKNKSGDLVNRLANDTTMVGHSISLNISDGLRSLVGACAAVSMMIYISPQLAMKGLSVLAPVAIITIVSGRSLKEITTDYNNALARSTAIATERIHNIKTVKAFVAEKSEERVYREKIQDVLDVARRSALAHARFFGMAGLSGNLTMLFILYSGGNLVFDHSLSIGELSAFFAYAILVATSAGGFSNFYVELMKGLGAGTRIFELIPENSDHSKKLVALKEPFIPRSDRFHGDVKFENVHFSYPSRQSSTGETLETITFENLSFHLPAESVTALVGPSGSGKTTVASLLLGFYSPERGRILIDNRDSISYDSDWLKRQIALVSQEPVLFSSSIRDNIIYGVEDRENISPHSIADVAQQSNSFNFIQQLPHQFDTMLGEGGSTISGGQKQRIAIARALMTNPKILIMDEATSALDAESEFLVKSAINSLMRESRRTVLIIAHRLSTVINADRILVLFNGRIRESGSYSELMQHPDGIFRKLVEKQMRGFPGNVQ